MSKKILATAIVLIALGGIAIPGGLVINNVIKDLTYSSVDEGLVGIKDQGIPLVIDSLHQIGPASALEIIKNRGIEASSPLANATILMNQINTIEKFSFPALPTRSLFFDQVYADTALGFTNFSNLVSNPLLLDLPPIQGISEWLGEDLNFTEGIRTDDFTGLNNLKYGVNTSTQWWGNRLPGIFEDTYKRVGDAVWPPTSTAIVDTVQDRGFGLMEILGLIESANKTEMELLCGNDGYNFTNPLDNFTYLGENYKKLEIFYLYITEYFYPQAIKLIVNDFNRDGSGVQGLYPQYIPDDWNEHDTSYNDLVYYSLIEQWAKCLSYDEGTDLHDSEPKIPVGTYGFEPAGPGEDSGINMEAALQLWNESNENSITNFPNGIQKWYNARNDMDVYNELLTYFEQFDGLNNTNSGLVWNENITYGPLGWGFNSTNMDLILNWLWGNGGGWSDYGSFSEYLLPILIEANFDTTLEGFAFQILLEQWANGTTMGYPLYVDGFPLPLGFADIFGFEVGYQGKDLPVIPTNISLESALALWNASSEYSLVSGVGISKWFAAVGGDNEVKSILQSKFNLADNQMELLLNWIPNFQQNVMPYLAQYQMGLPTDSITLGNIIQGAMILVGAISLGLGATGLIGNVVTKRKTKIIESKKKKNPFKLGSKTKK